MIILLTLITISLGNMYMDIVRRKLILVTIGTYIKGLILSCAHLFPSACYAGYAMISWSDHQAVASQCAIAQCPKQQLLDQV